MLLIKWNGYDATNNTWEPLQTFYNDASELVNEYFKSKGFELICKYIQKNHEEFTLFRQAQGKNLKIIYVNQNWKGCSVEKKWKSSEQNQTS